MGPRDPDESDEDYCNREGLNYEDIDMKINTAAEPSISDLTGFDGWHGEVE